MFSAAAVKSSELCITNQTGFGCGLKWRCVDVNALSGSLFGNAEMTVSLRSIRSIDERADGWELRRQSRMHKGKSGDVPISFSRH